MSNVKIQNNPGLSVECEVTKAKYKVELHMYYEPIHWIVVENNNSSTIVAGFHFEDVANNFCQMLNRI